MKIALIGNKLNTKCYNMKSYSYIVRYNGCNSLSKTYTFSTDLWFFHGNNLEFYSSLEKQKKRINYINKNCKHKISYNGPNEVLEEHILNNVVHEMYEDHDIVNEMCELIGYKFDEKLRRVTTPILVIGYILINGINENETIDVFCLDEDRKEHTKFHAFPEEEYALIQYLIKNKYIRFIK